MILSDLDIERKYKEAEEKRNSVNLRHLKPQPNIVGHPIHYFFVVGNDRSHICGLPARVLSVTPAEGDVDAVPFHIDLAIETAVPGFYMEESNIPVISMTLEDAKGKTQTGVCKFDDFEVVEKIMNNKFVPEKPKSGIKLVVDNSAKENDNGN